MPTRKPLAEVVGAALRGRQTLTDNTWLAAGTAGLWLTWDDAPRKDEAAGMLAGMQLLQDSLTALYGPQPLVEVDAETGEPLAGKRRRQTKVGHMTVARPDSPESRTDPATRVWQVSVHFLRDVAAQCGNTALAALIDDELQRRALVRGKAMKPVSVAGAGGIPSAEAFGVPTVTTTPTHEPAAQAAVTSHSTASSQRHAMAGPIAMAQAQVREKDLDALSLAIVWPVLYGLSLPQQDEQGRPIQPPHPIIGPGKDPETIAYHLGSGKAIFKKTSLGKMLSKQRVAARKRPDR